MADDYKSVTDGAILISTIVGWSLAFDWIAYRFPRIGKLVEPGPLPLVERGRINRRNLREEFLSEEDLMAKLREQGVERVDEVKRATMVTVIRFDRRDAPRPNSKHPA